MSSNPKIMVFKLREIVYTLVLVFLAIALIVCLVLMFSGHTGESTRTAQNPEAPADTESTADDSGSAQSSATEQNDSGSAQSSATEQNDSGSAQSSATEQNDSGSAQSTAANSGTYTAGVYSSPVMLGDSSVDVQVTVSSNAILAVDLVNLNEAVSAAYPLVPSAFENIASQVLEKQKLDGITCSAENRYTSQLLLNAVSKALKLAQN